MLGPRRTGGGDGKTSGKPGSNTGHSGHAVIVSIVRHRSNLTVKLRCTASSDKPCKSALGVDLGSRRLAHKTFTFRGGTTKTFRLHLPAIATKARKGHRKPAMKVIARTGSYRASRSFT